MQRIGKDILWLDEVFYLIFEGLVFAVEVCLRVVVFGIIAFYGGKLLFHIDFTLPYK